MIKNLIVNRSDLEALIRDYYECEERKEFGRPNTSSSKTQTDCLSMVTSVR